jgi:geranylgeranyl diphosphate synthase, type II
MRLALESDMVAGSMLNFDLDAYAAPRRKLIEQQLDEYLPEREPAALWQAMRYSVLAGGKRIRALLCLASAEALEHMHSSKFKAVEAALPCACAIEMIHAMSLIHDDLPCMDNDDFRRGKPTNHKVYGQAMALLAGDALLVHAGELLLRRTPAHIDSTRLIDIAAEMARASGPHGMVGGQVADCIATGLVPQGKPAATVNAELLESIHKRKTGALLRFSTWSGARLMGGSDEVVEALADFGELLGLAFQIADDLLDTTGDLQTLGKTPGKDQASGKLTWVSIYGIDGSQQTLAALQKKGESLLRQTQLPADATAPLNALLAYAIQRRS